MPPPPPPVVIKLIDLKKSRGAPPLSPLRFHRPCFESFSVFLKPEDIQHKHSLTTQANYFRLQESLFTIRPNPQIYIPKYDK